MTHVSFSILVKVQMKDGSKPSGDLIAEFSDNVFEASSSAIDPMILAALPEGMEIVNGEDGIDFSEDMNYRTDPETD